MMTELSLNVLDIVENSTKAKASLVFIGVEIDSAADSLIIRIDDDGCGMDSEQLARVTDPFFTTRTTRKVGLGVPFFKQSAEMTGGDFIITSEPGVGTKITARYVLSSIDRMPLGDMTATIHQLILMHQDCDFLYRYSYDGKEFTLDTRELRVVLEGVPFDVPDVSAYIKDFLTENTAEVNEGHPAV
ncbi:MAG: sensor histidine kinase [Lachnospiraceae bacterium]|jgi:hypothetical protein|nr:sensor histidine kinase [Lachnospiraceae bacterium]